MTPLTYKRPGPARRRSAARLAAVQALYQLDMSDIDIRAEGVLDEFSRFRLDGEGARQDFEAEGDLIDPDRDFFADLVRGVQVRWRDLDTVIDAALEKGWTARRLETVLRCILRSGTYELMMRQDVPARVVISEYLDTAHAFFCGAEAGLVNGVLDRIAHTLRADEFRARDDAPG